MSRCSGEALGEAGGLAHLLWDGVALRDPDWAWEALALMELFPDTVMVGGRILDAQQRVTSAAALFGFGKGCDAPDRMRPINDPGYFAMLWKPHSTSAVSSQHAVFRAGFLRTLLDQPEAGSRMSLAYLGAWAGAAARRLGGRVVYSPFLHGQAEQDWNELVTARERAAFVLANADLMPERRYASAHFGSDPTAPHRAAPAAQRAAQHEALLKWARSSAHAGAAHDGRRTHRSPPTACRLRDNRHDALRGGAGPPHRRPSGVLPPVLRPGRFGILTTVYIRTDAELLRATAASLFAQSVPFDAWIILAHGPIAPETDAALGEIARDPRVTMLREPVNLGIVGGMRLCLEQARTEYVVPMDADDC